MIKKQLNAAFLLAGTAIGSGMISLPMVLAKFGIINSCLIMLAFSILTYLTALIRSDLNLNSRAEATLKEVGNIFECSWAGKFGDFLLKILSFALMAAYISGGASIIDSFFENIIPFHAILILFAIIIAAIFFFASDFVSHINGVLFVVMFSVLIALIIVLFSCTTINVTSHQNIIPHQINDVQLHEWTTLVPIIFTSFGFQGSIHSMTKLCNNDRSLIKNACLWGSLIPAFVYMIWTASVLFVVCNTDAHFFSLMLEGKATDVGELVRVLSNALLSTKFTENIQNIVWFVSALAIFTSIIGVGLALLDIFQEEWQLKKWKSVLFITIVPAMISMFVPNAFIRILNVSGIILSFIAIIVPVIISWKMQNRKTLKTLLLIRNDFVMAGVFICGIVIIALGLFDLLLIS